MRLEVGQRRKVAIAEGEPVVVIPDVEDIAKAIGQSVDKAEVAAIGTASNPGRLEGDPHGLSQRPLDLELDLLATRLTNMKRERLLGGKELPVEKVLQVAAVHRDKLGAGLEPQLRRNRIGLYCGYSDHPAPGRGRCGTVRS